MNWLAQEVPPRTVLAVMNFAGAPDREREAAEAWAFELTYYFTRAVGEQPEVTYEDGVYTCTGLMTTTHPGDTAPVTYFDNGEPASLDFCADPKRRDTLRRLYARRGARFDGRDAANA